MNRIGHDLSVNLRRLVRLIGREGFHAAWRKGWPYLKRRFADEVQLRKITRTLNPEERFTKIYLWNFWRAAESRSGPGSSLLYTEKLRRQLPEMFRRFSIKTMIDAPCGDFHWMRHLMEECDIVYVGGDIVQPMIEQDQRDYANDHIRFVHLDITKGPLPNVDLWFCRDCFCHLSVADIRASLQRFAESDIPYLFASHVSAPLVPHNHDIVSGDFRPVALFEPPFSLPRDVLYRIDDVYGDDKSSSEMCLWTRQQVAQALKAST